MPQITDAERHRLLVEWNQTEMNFPHTLCLHECFEALALQLPDALAVASEDQQLTYHELNRRANQLAHELRAAGVGPDVLVCLYMERTAEVLVGLLGILKAGGAYVTLDPGYPVERIAHMLEEIQAAVILTRSCMKSALPPSRSRIICLDTDWVQIAQQPCHTPATNVLLDHLAYVIYTSGSTGRPKGIQVSHANLLNLVFWHLYTYQPASGDRISQITSLSFDPSVWETWTALLAGACLCLPTTQTRLSLVNLQHWWIEQQITFSYLPTPLAEEILALPLPEMCHLKVLFIGGDKLRRLPEQELPFTLVDCYGPAECTVNSIVGAVPTGTSAERVPSIGRPIGNTQIYLLDDRLDPVLCGEVGEIYLGGAGLARGYLQRPDLTAERFIPNLFSNVPGERLYRTGDLARYRPDGRIEYIGRFDHQIKIRGQRVEVGEIELTLLTHQRIREVVVIAHGEPGNKQLIAYIVPEKGGHDVLYEEELRSYAQRLLPDYMVPSAFVLLDAMPLLPNGKLDRRALPDWQAAERRATYEAPANTIEIILAEIWSTVLSVQRIGRYDNFFALGGNSLSAMQMLSRIRLRLHIEVPIATLFQTPILIALAEYIQQQDGKSVPMLRNLSPAQSVTHTADSVFPLSFAQQQLWLLNELEPTNSSYTILMPMRLRGPLDIRALFHALNAIVQRHETLRTTFAVRQGQLVQIIALESTLPSQLVDLQALTIDEEREAVVQHLIDQEAQCTFDLSRGPLFHAYLLRLDPLSHILVITMHHIISDGWSQGTLVQELTAFYLAFVEKAIRPTLPDLPLRYTDYVIWQRTEFEELAHEQLQEDLAYWKQQLAGGPARLELPTDYPRPAVRTFRGKHTSLVLARPIAQGLLSSGLQKAGYTPFMILLAVFQVLLARFSGDEDIVVGTPFINRNRAELEGLIGLFLNTLPLRVRCSHDLTFLELLERVRTACLQAYEHQSLPFDRLLEELKIKRSLSHTPIFQVFFNMLNMVNYPMHPLDWHGVTAEVFSVHPEGAKFDLTLYAQERNEGIVLTAVYNTDLFKEERMQELLRQFVYLCEQIVARPWQRISQYSLVTPTARALLPDPTAPLSTKWEGSVPTLFAKHALCTPEHPAIIDGERIWSYRELDEVSNQIAPYLHAHGIQSRQVVAIYAHRSAALVCAILGVLKAGAAYLILDPTYPPLRLVEYIRQADVHGLIQLEGAGSLLPPLEEALTLQAMNCWLTLPDGPVAAVQEVLNGIPTNNLEVTIGPDDIACIAFTSGSTGRPKGVLQRHGPLTHFLPWQQQAFELNSQDRYSLLSALAHDPLQRDIFTPLCLGATICVPTLEHITASGGLIDWLQKYSINVMHLTPVLLRLITQAALSLPEPVTLPSLRRVLVVGDLLTRHDVFLLQQIAPAVQCVNLYGTTETQRAVSYYVVPALADSTSQDQAQAQKLPLGRGVEDAQLLLLNRTQNLAGVGEPGEIALRSPHLAKGYLADEQLTRQRFLPNPFTGVEGDLLYKTGDLGYYRPDGNVEHLGRQDHQVKLRGFRIELYEIELTLRLHKLVKEAVVVAREEGDRDKYLVAYIVPFARQGRDDELQHDLWQFLFERLPNYMVPSAFVILDALPMLPNNKIDYSALPAPVLRNSEQGEQKMFALKSIEEDRTLTESEEILVEIWKQVLQVKEVGVYENFFELGGHSLLAVQVLAHILEGFQVNLPLRVLFEAPTIASLAVVIEQYRFSHKPQQQPELMPLARRIRRSMLSPAGKQETTSESM